MPSGRRRRCCPRYADDDQGFVALPAVGTEVVVGFEAGDLRRPYIVGSCWNGQEMMPLTPTRPNNKRLIRAGPAACWSSTTPRAPPR